MEISFIYLLVMRFINLQRAKVYVFSDSVLCLEKIHQNLDVNEAWRKRKNGSQFLKVAETMMLSMES